MRLATIPDANAAGKAYAETLFGAVAANSVLEAVTLRGNVDFASAVAALRVCAANMSRKFLQLPSRSRLARLMRQQRRNQTARAQEEQRASGQDGRAQDASKRAQDESERAQDESERAQDDYEGSAERACAQDDDEGSAERACAQDDDEGSAERACAQDDDEGSAEKGACAQEPTEEEQEKEPVSFGEPRDQDEASAQNLRANKPSEEIIGASIAAALHLVPVCINTAAHVFHDAHVDAYISARNLHQRFTHAMKLTRERTFKAFGNPTTPEVCTANTMYIALGLHRALKEAIDVFEVLAMPV